MAADLSHTSFSGKHAAIYADGGKPTERKVGTASRIQSKLPINRGRYVYTVRDLNGACVYSGASMKSGMEALAAFVAA